MLNFPLRCPTDCRKTRIRAWVVVVALFWGAVSWTADIRAVDFPVHRVKSSDRSGATSGPAETSPDRRSQAAFASNSEIAWEYSPYQVVVWLVDDGSQVFRQLEDRIRQRIERDALLEEFNGWNVHCARPDVIWNARLDRSGERELANLAKPLAEDVSLRGADKLIVIRLSQSAARFSIDARELDLATVQWGRVTETDVAESDLLAARAYAAFRASFMPLTRIERVANETIYTRIRASALSRRLEVDGTGNMSEVPNRESPLWVRDNDVLLPVLRRESRDNRSFNAETVAWTFLTIDERQGSTLKCATQTAQFAPLSGRSGSALRKLALVVRPNPQPTMLFITAQESKSAAPIPGLEVYVCSPKGLATRDYQLLGKTDWKGAISVAPSENGSIRYVIIKNGQLAVKKPVLPGLVSTLTAAVPSDRARVFAEGVIFGLRGEIIDLAALRATTKMRIEIALENKQFEKANKILNEEYLKLRSVRQLGIRLTEIKERLLNRRDADARQRVRIESMFAGLEKAIRDKLSDQDASELTTRVLNKISDSNDALPPGEAPDPDPGDIIPPAKREPSVPGASQDQEFD